MATSAGITGDSSISQVMRMHPEAFRVLLAHGMGCAACLGASDETVAECALMRGIPADVLVAELNAVLQHPSAA